MMQLRCNLAFDVLLQVACPYGVCISVCCLRRQHCVWCTASGRGLFHALAVQLVSLHAPLL
jgi:hypothetical protein